MGCQHLDDIYELYLLGAVSASESSDLQEHVDRGCSYCLERLREAVQIVYLLSQNTRAVQPSSRLKCELLRQLKKSKTHDGRRGRR